jgi:exocyst complex component 4
VSRRLDALLKIYEQLAKIILFTIRIDVRCRLIWHILRGLREVSVLHPKADLILIFRSDQESYDIDLEASDPDDYIVELNAEIAACYDATSSSLGDRGRR